MELQPEKPEEDAQTRTIYNQQQIQPSYDDNSGNQTKATYWWEVSLLYLISTSFKFTK